jgi:hypothetical protein
MRRSTHLVVVVPAGDEGAFEASVSYLPHKRVQQIVRVSGPTNTRSPTAAHCKVP